MQMLKQARKEFVKAHGIIKAKKRKSAFDVYSMGFIQSYISIAWLDVRKTI